jgi:magnesium-transporting ATPase (P-type)
MLSLALLTLFIVCGLVFARASKELSRLDRLRLEREPPPNPDPILGAATEFARRMGIPMAPGGEVLKDFCRRHDLIAAYDRANRLMYGSIVVAVLCAAIVIKLGPITAKS